MRNVEYLVQTGFTDVQPDDDYFLSQQGKADSQIGCDKRFPFTTHGGSDEDHLLVRLAQHEQQAGAYAPEGFRHDVVVVFANGNGMFISRFGFGERDITDYGDGSELFYVVASFDAETEQIQDVDNGNRNTEAEHEGNQVNELPFGGYRGFVCQCVVYDFGIVGGGCKGDIVLFAFLQQHEIKARLDFLLALDADETAFLSGSIADAPGIFPCLAVEVGFGDKQSFAHAGNGGDKIGAHVLDIAVEPLYDGVGFGRSA